MGTPQIFYDLDSFIREHFYTLLLLAFFISFSVHNLLKRNPENN